MDLDFLLLIVPVAFYQGVSEHGIIIRKLSYHQFVCICDRLFAEQFGCEEFTGGYSTECNVIYIQGIEYIFEVYVCQTDG